jgi:cytochrome c5
MREEWLMPGAVVPVDPDTTKELVDEIKSLIGIIGGMALQAAAPVQEPDYKALWQQMCERCDELDKELSATDRQVEILSDALAESRREVAALKINAALDKKAENARELGLDYEPADGTQVSKVWWDGEKLMAKPISLVDFYQPMQDSTCSETLRAQGKAYPRTCRKCGKGPCIGAPKQSPAAQRQWTGLTDEDVYLLANEHLHYQTEGYEVSGVYNLARAIEAKLKKKNNG